MPEPMLLPLIWEYLKATVSYWWLIVPGLLMPIPDVYRHFFHPQGKELVVPRWLRLSVGVACLFLAQFLAYRNQTLNLTRVIEEKRQFSVTINELNTSLKEEKNKNANAKPCPPLSQDTTRKVNLKKRVNELGKNVFDAYMDIEKQREQQMAKDRNENMTSQQRAQRWQQVQKDFDDAQQKQWQNNALAVAAVLEEINEEGEKATGISARHLQEVRFFCVPLGPHSMIIKECGIRLKALGERMH